MKLRFESFGAILSLNRPPALIYLNRDALLRWGYPFHPKWARSCSHLSAPIEAHLVVTNRCSAGCRHCYVGSTPAGDPDELDTAGWKRVIDHLADMGVFHLAMGGGESLERPDLFELAAYVRSRGLVPNLTTNGLHMTPDIARRCRVFGQINVSLDDTRDDPASPRAIPPSRAIESLKILRRAGCRSGINMVVTSRSFTRIEAVARLAHSLKLHDVELLRFKPFGRGTKDYARHALTPEQADSFYPEIVRISKTVRLPLKVDCSFVPMIAWHRPNRHVMDRFGVLGCEAGNHLIGVTPNGRVSGCSFLSPTDIQATVLRENWEDDRFVTVRHFKEIAAEPCKSCAYLEQCNGGCRAVARHLTGGDNPDPECPFVRRHLANIPR